MTTKEKAEELVDKFYLIPELNGNCIITKHSAKQCAIIAVKNEYHSLREMLFNLASSRVIESEKVYLFRLQELINNENELIQEIENL